MAIGYYVRCDEVVELVSDYLEHALDASETEAIEQHVVSCTACADYIEQMRATLQLAGSLRNDPVLDDAGLSPLLRLFHQSVARGQP
ncbi:MAG: anti-sigma factor [Myxococcaceae bacterium]|nr:anti-sigma factor [Myxococcaceae bacterium]